MCDSACRINVHGLCTPHGYAAQRCALSSQGRLPTFVFVFESGVEHWRICSFPPLPPGCRSLDRPCLCLLFKEINQAKPQSELLVKNPLVVQVLWRLSCPTCIVYNFFSVITISGRTHLRLFQSSLVEAPYFLFESSLKKYEKMTPILYACAVVITLETQVSKRAPCSIEINYLTNCNRQKWYTQNKRTRADLQNLVSNFLTFAPGLRDGLSKLSDNFPRFFRLRKTIT